MTHNSNPRPRHPGQATRRPGRHEGKTNPDRPQARAASAR
jgi:hypothetical protein